MTTWFLIFHEYVPDTKRIQVFAGMIRDSFWLRSFQSRNETFAQQAAGRISAVGIETEANYFFPIAHDVGNQRQNANGHLAEIDICVRDLGFNGDNGLADINDVHSTISIVNGDTTRMVMWAMGARALAFP